MTSTREEVFIHAFNDLAADIYANAAAKGFWEQGHDRNRSEMIALMHSELSEALEALRKPDLKGKTDYPLEAEELADTIIRIMDYANAWKLPVAEALIQKMHYNSTREYKHGKKF